MSDTTLAAAQGLEDIEASVADVGPRERGFLIKIDDELELVTWRGNQAVRPWQVERGVLGTAAAAHDDGATITVEPTFNLGPALVVADAVDGLADPSTATAEDCANAINALLASLRAAGTLAAS